MTIEITKKGMIITLSIVGAIVLIVLGGVWFV